MADQQTPPSNGYASAYEKMIVFDRVFDELAHESESSATMQDDKGTVGRDELQKRLIATGMFNYEDALAIIDETVRIRKIKIVMLNTYMKSSNNSNSKEHAPA